MAKIPKRPTKIDIVEYGFEETNSTLTHIGYAAK
jgi:hypothetical protein